MPIERERVSLTGWFPAWVRHEHFARYGFAAQWAAGKVVIDCACGDGSCARLLAETAAQVHAFDRSKFAIAQARHVRCGPNVHFQVADVAALPVPSDFADLYVSLETIEHLRDDAAFLFEVVRVLKDDGAFICSTPDRYVYSPGNTIASRPWNRFHVREYAQDEFTRLLGRYFGRVTLFGQNPKAPWLVGLKARLGRWLPGHAVVRLNQALKLPRLLYDRLEHHLVTPAETARRYEGLTAVCTMPRQAAPTVGPSPGAPHGHFLRQGS